MTVKKVEGQIKEDNQLKLRPKIEIIKRLEGLASQYQCSPQQIIYDLISSYLGLWIDAQEEQQALINKQVFSSRVDLLSRVAADLRDSEGVSPERIKPIEKAINANKLIVKPGVYLQCPECVTKSAGIELVIHLNDDHRWSRERIADHLEEIGY